MITHGCARGNLSDENIELAILREQEWYNPETGIFSSRNHSGVRFKGFRWNGYIGVSGKSKKFLANWPAWFYKTGRVSGGERGLHRWSSPL
ncbi:hypothetical protein, partial [Morganella morganii]|uniref:hypothetical protein n=1 Tax=Morganella morganii TaxID=582 RepID=UPI001C71320C